MSCFYLLDVCIHARVCAGDYGNILGVFVCGCLFVCVVRACVHLCENYYITNVNKRKCFNNSRILLQQNIIISLIVLT